MRGGGGVVVGIGVIGEQCDAVARRKVADVTRDLVNDAPTFVAGRSRIQRILEPGPPFPDGNVRTAYTTPLEPHPDFTGARRRDAHIPQLSPQWIGYDGGSHDSLFRGRLNFLLGSIALQLRRPARGSTLGTACDARPARDRKPKR